MKGRGKKTEGEERRDTKKKAKSKERKGKEGVRNMRWMEEETKAIFTQTETKTPGPDGRTEQKLKQLFLTFMTETM